MAQVENLASFAIMRFHKSLDNQNMKVFAAVLALLLAASSNGQFECRTGRSCRCTNSNPCRHESKYGLTFDECEDECKDEGDDCKG